MKSYTDLEQSKKLAEILPIESADMYRVFENNAETRVYYGKMPTAYFVCKPCWSLAALLNILPKKYYPTLEDNLIDACYKMILNLHELKIL